MLLPLPHRAERRGRTVELQRLQVACLRLFQRPVRVSSVHGGGRVQWLGDPRLRGEFASGWEEPWCTLPGQAHFPSSAPTQAGFRPSLLLIRVSFVLLVEQAACFITTQAFIN